MDERVLEAFAQLNTKIETDFPDLAQIMRDAKDGQITKEEAVVRMAKLLADPGLAKAIETMALDTLSPLREEKVAPGIYLSEDGSSPLVVLDDAHPVPMDPLFQPSAGLPRINPLMEAAIAERLQFDGDIPEMRHAALPEDSMPAVPVETSARSPLAIGVMLKTAATEVKQEIVNLRETHLEKMTGLLEAVDDNPTALQEIMPLVPAAPEPAGYAMGKVPDLRPVAPPEGAALLKLSDEERRQASWQVFATTQGRRSALNAIRDLILEHLAEQGVQVRVNDKPALRQGATVYAEWTADMPGPNSTNPHFNFISTAGAAIARRLLSNSDLHQISDPVLEVITINTVDVRKVGWAARVVPG